VRFYVVGPAGVRRLDDLQYACFFAGIVRGLAEVWVVGGTPGQAALFTGECYSARTGARRLTKARATAWGADYSDKPDHTLDPPKHTLWCFEDSKVPESLERVLVESQFWP
jgi:hypothetical protein